MADLGFYDEEPKCGEEVRPERARVGVGVLWVGQRAPLRQPRGLKKCCKFPAGSGRYANTFSLVSIQKDVHCWQ